MGCYRSSEYDTVQLFLERAALPTITVTQTTRISTPVKHVMRGLKRRGNLTMSPKEEDTKSQQFSVLHVVYRVSPYESAYTNPSCELHFLYRCLWQCSSLDHSSLIFSYNDSALQRTFARNEQIPVRGVEMTMGLVEHPAIRTNTFGTSNTF